MPQEGNRVQAGDQETDTQGESARAGYGRIVAFDFDGTCIAGNSPVTLVAELTRKHMISPKVTALILWWAAKYKLRLPQDETWVREQVFLAFNGRKAKTVDAYLAKFYDDKIEKRFRKQVDALMRKYREEGYTVLVVSASFEPIVLRAQELHPFDAQESTVMCVDDEGNYMNKVQGAPVEGEEKVVRIKAFGDRTFGPGNWELSAAYGDHHSDIPMLKMAKEAYAVDPDTTLSRVAQENNWHIIAWK